METILAIVFALKMYIIIMYIEGYFFFLNYKSDIYVKHDEAIKEKPINEKFFFL